MKLFKIIPLIALIAVSCSKEEETAPSKKVSYFPMSIGNFWVYGFYNIDTLGNDHPGSFKNDSIAITHKETIDNKEYFVFEGIGYPYLTGDRKTIKKLRDSSGYLVDPSGRIHFASSDLRDSLRVEFSLPFYSIVYQMRVPTNLISVPAGTFKALNFHGNVWWYENLPIWVKNPRSDNNYYAKGVGEILDTYFYSMQMGYSEKRLLRYHVD